MWKCPVCGYEGNPEEAGFCINCGVKPVDVEAVEEAEERREPGRGAGEESWEAGYKCWLSVVSSPDEDLIGVRVPLDFEYYGGRITVGRGRDNVMVIPDASVSRRHAAIYLDEGRVVLEDLGSTNGTYIYSPDEGGFVMIDGKVELKPGMLVRLAYNTVLLFECGSRQGRGQPP